MSLNLEGYKSFNTGFLIRDTFFYKADDLQHVTDLYKKVGFFRALFIVIAEKFGSKSSDYKKSNMGAKEFYVIKVTDKQLTKVTALISKKMAKPTPGAVESQRPKDAEDSGPPTGELPTHKDAEVSGPPRVEKVMSKEAEDSRPTDAEMKPLEHAVKRLMCIKDLGIDNTLPGAKKLNDFGKKSTLKLLNGKLKTITKEEIAKVKSEVKILIDELNNLLSSFDRGKILSELRKEESVIRDYLSKSETREFTTPVEKRLTEEIVAKQREGYAKRLLVVQAKIKEIESGDSMFIRNLIKEKCQSVDSQFADNLKTFSKSDLGFYEFD